VAHAGITCHAERVRKVALLIHREQDIGLHAQDKDRCVREGTQARCERAQVRRRVGRRWVRAFVAEGIVVDVDVVGEGPNAVRDGPVISNRSIAFLDVD